MDWEVKCAKCNLYYPIASVHKYDNGYYCKKCYKEVKGLPYEAHEVKTFVPPVRNEVARELTRFYQEKCEACGMVLTRFDDKIQDGGKLYCKSCYAKATNVPAYGMINRSGFLPRRGVTTVSDASVLFECTACGMVLTPDKLKEDRDGRVICPKCSSVLPIRVRVADTLKGLKDADYSPTARLFKCLGDPCRVKIIELLSQNEMCVYEVVEMTGFQYSAISYHLKMLKGLGLVRSVEKGNFMVYSLTEKGSTVHEFVEKSKSLS